MIDSHQVAAVVVTRDRPQLLQEVIAALLQQSSQLGKIVIVDNASGAPTQELLQNIQNPLFEILRLETNTGGTGGFTHGLSHAMAAADIDYFWLMDDDAVPDQYALEKLLEQGNKLPSSNKFGALCSAVIEFGEYAVLHRRLFDASTLRETTIPVHCYQQVMVEIDTGSFVSFLVSREALVTAGLPNIDFFLAYDDTEYSLRLKKYGFSLWLIPDSIINHKRPKTGRLRSSPYGVKHYFNLRNQLIVFNKYGKASYRYYIKPILFSALLALWNGKPRFAALSLWLKAVRNGLAERYENDVINK